LAGWVLLKIAYVLTCRMLGLVVLLCRGDQGKDAELLVLRHENAVLQHRQFAFAGCDLVLRAPRKRLLSPWLGHRPPGHHSYALSSHIRTCREERAALGGAAAEWSIG
jgi:hypothetical protein